MKQQQHPALPFLISFGVSLIIFNYIAIMRLNTSGQNYIIQLVLIAIGLVVLIIAAILYKY